MSFNWLGCPWRGVVEMWSGLKCLLLWVLEASGKMAATFIIEPTVKDEEPGLDQQMLFTWWSQKQKQCWLLDVMWQPYVLTHFCLEIVCQNPVLKSLTRVNVCSCMHGIIPRFELWGASHSQPHPVLWWFVVRQHIIDTNWQTVLPTIQDNGVGSPNQHSWWNIAI